MARLVDDLRTLALADAGALPLHREPTDPEVLVEDVARSLRPAAEASGVAIAPQAQGPFPLVDVDPVRIREVLTNLVANALRYAPAGSEVRVLLEMAGGGTAVSLSVVDTGPGIAADLLPHVFDRFARSPDSRGSGLGLAIARQLVEAHGGRIDLESTPGTGTRVRFEVPVHASAV